MRSRLFVPSLAAVLLAGVLVAAAFTGQSEARFAVQGSIECPPFDIGQPISELERKYGLEYQRRVGERFLRARTAMGSVPRVGLLIDEFLRDFEEMTSTAEFVVTGTVTEQRLGHLDAPYTYGLVSILDNDDVRVIHRIRPSCREKESLLLGYWPATPPLEPGQRYAIVVGPQRADGTREALLAYRLDGIKITEYWPVANSPIGGGSVLDQLIAAMSRIDHRHVPVIPMVARVTTP
jgi:hypothetical protein